MFHGSAPNSGGRLWKFLSKITPATPRSRIEAPMVMMISVTAEAPRAGSIARLCSSNPVAVAATTASSMAAGSGTPAAARKNVTMPPIITNSPWAKLMTSDEL